MSSEQPIGILGGSGGQAIAQLLAGQVRDDKNRQPDINFPSLIQAMAFSKSADARADALAAENTRKQASFDQSQGALERLRSGGGLASQAADFQQAGISGTAQGKLLENLITQDEEGRRAEGLQIFNQELEAAVKEGMSPEQAVPLVLMRLGQDKEASEKLAAAFGTDPKVLKDLSAYGQDLLINRQEAEAMPIIQGALNKMTADTGTNMQAILRNPVMLDKALQRYLRESALEFSKESPPPEGMSTEDWLQRNTKIAMDAYTRVFNPNTGAKQQTGANIIQRLKVLAGISNAMLQPELDSRKVEIAADRNQVARERNAITLQAAKIRGSGRGGGGSTKGMMSLFGPDDEARVYDRDGDGQLNKREQKEYFSDRTAGLVEGVGKADVGKAITTTLRKVFSKSTGQLREEKQTQENRSSGGKRRYTKSELEAIARKGKK